MYYLGIDLGGTKIAAAISDQNLIIKEELEVPTPTTKTAIYNELTEIIHMFSREYDITAIGIGTPGMIDNKGKVLNAPNLKGWNNFPLKNNLEKEFSSKIYIENDANCAAIAELIQGVGQKYSNFIYLTISTGIGGGIIINNNIYRGATGIAGEMGHMVLEKDGPKCGCGSKGCWEAIASGTGMANKAKKNNQIKKVAGKEKITTKLLAKLAKNKNKAALAIFTEAAKYHALAINNLINLFNPQAIIIGGGVSKNGNIFWQPLKKELKALGVNVKTEKAKSNSGTIGALALAIKGN